MPQQSNIEWCDATWNPVTGCSKVSQGCKNCYAEAYFARPYPGRKFTDVRIHPERLDWPLRWRGSPQAKAEGRPSRIFVNSMSDLFHDHVPTNFIAAVHLVASMRPDLIFQILTKRPENMLAFHLQKRVYLHTLLEEGVWIDDDDGMSESLVRLPGKMEKRLRLVDGDPSLDEPLPNVWLIVSVEDQPTADERVRILLETPAAVRGVSYEPALGPVDFIKFLPHRVTAACDMSSAALDCGALEEWYPGLDWVVAGGESGPHARPPHPDWFRSVRDQCAAAGVPFFFKQWGNWAPVTYMDQHDQAILKVSVSTRESMKTSTKEIVDGDCNMVWMPKKKAGRLLDGREHNAFPEVRSVKDEG